MHRLESNIMHHAKKQREQRKYLVWVGGGYNAFDNLLDAEIEKKEWEYKGYTDIQIETIKQT